MKLLIFLLFLLPMLASTWDILKSDGSLKNALEAHRTLEDVQKLKVMMKSLNDDRREFARRGKISNMNELVYDEELAQNAEEHGKACPLRANHGASYREFLTGMDNVMNILELFVPSQTKIGCALACKKLLTEMCKMKVE